MKVTTQLGRIVARVTSTVQSELTADVDFGRTKTCNVLDETLASFPSLPPLSSALRLGDRRVCSASDRV
jgi:hypothetical protein